jgi:hypothetical protein
VYIIWHKDFEHAIKFIVIDNMLIHVLYAVHLVNFSCVFRIKGTVQLVVNAAFPFTGVNTITDTRKCRNGTTENVHLQIMFGYPTTDVIAGHYMGIVIFHQKSVPT